MQFCPQNKKDTAKLGQVQQRAPKIVRAGALALWGEAGGSWVCLAWSRSGFRGTYELAACTQQEVRARLLTAVHGGRICNNSHKLKRERSTLNTRKHLFPQWGQSGSETVSSLGDFQDLTGQTWPQNYFEQDFSLESIPWSPFQPQLSDDGVLLSPSAPKENEIRLFSPI